MATNAGQKNHSGKSPKKNHKVKAEFDREFRHRQQYHKQSRSKYIEHHATSSEYPKLFWDSSKKGTYRRSNG